MRRRAIAVSVVLCLSFVLLAGHFAQNAEVSRSADNVARWEHMAYPVSAQGGISNPEISRTIIKLGNEGWELVDVEGILENGSTKTTVYYFKRPK